jgi:hypothetical protein
MNAQDEPHGMSQEMLLEIFDAPITFHRCLVPVAGGVTAALLLSQAIWLNETQAQFTQGWFMCSQEQWTQETGLSRWEQETARRELRVAGLIEERLVGMPAKLWFRVCPQAIRRAMEAVLAQRRADDKRNSRG